MTQGRIDFGSNLPDIVQTVRAGVTELEAILSSAGGNVAKTGLLGEGLQRDIGEFENLKREIADVERRLARLGSIQNPANAARSLDAIERKLQNIIALQSRLSHGALGGIEQGFVELPASDFGSPGASTRQLKKIESYNQKLEAANRKSEAEAKRHAEQMDKLQGQALEMDRRMQAARGGYVQTGSHLIDPKTGEVLRLTQAGQGARPIDGLVEEQRAEQSRRAYYEKSLRDQRHALARSDPAAAFAGGLGSRGLGGDSFSAAGIAGAFGTTIKYTALYGSLFAVTGAFRDTIKEAKDYRDSLTDLKVAIGGTIDQQDLYVNSLAKISRFAGGNVGEALDSAARGIRAFTQPGDSKARKEEVGFDFAKAVGRAAVITGKSITDIRGDVVAIASSFELTANEFERINDVAAGSKLFGGDPAQITQGLANSGQALKEVGFSLEESGALISRVIAKLDESGQVAATRLSRITSIVSGGAGRSLLASLPGVGVEGTARDQIFRLAQAYQTLNAAQKAAVRNTLGQANVRELSVLLQELGPGGALQKGFTDGFDNAGRGASEFNRKTTDLVGTLKKLSGTISNVQNDLFDAGVFVPFGVALKLLLPALKTLDDILNLLNHLFPTWARNAAFAIGEVALGLVILGKFQLNAAKGAALAADAMWAEVRASGALTLSLEQQAVAARGVAAANILAARSNMTIGGSLLGIGANSAGRGISGLSSVASKTIVGVIVAIIADQLLTAAGDVRNKADAARTANATSRGAIGDATDATGLHAAAQELSAAAKKNDTASSGFLGNLRDDFNKTVGSTIASYVPGIGGALALGLGLKPGEDNEKTAKEQRQARDLLQARVEQLAVQQDQAAARGQASVFGDVTSVDNLNNGLEALQRAGKDATTQFNLLAQALGAAIATGEHAAGTILPGGGPVLGERVAASYVKAAVKARGDQKVGGAFTELEQTKLRLSVADQVTKFVDEAGLSDGGQLTPEQISTLAEQLADRYVDPDATKTQIEAMRKALLFALLDNIGQLTDPSKLLLDPTTSAQAQALLVERAQAKGANISAITGDKVLGARATINSILATGAIARRTGGDVTEDTRDALIAAQRDLDQALSSRADSYDTLAKARLGSNNNLGQLHVDLAQAERHYAEAIKAGNVEGANQALASAYDVADQIRKAREDLEDLTLQRIAAERLSSLPAGDRLARAHAEVLNAREAERLALARVRRGRSAPTLDFDTQGNVTGAAPDFTAKGEGIGAQFVTGIEKTDFGAVGKETSEAIKSAWEAQDWDALGSLTSQQLADAFSGTDFGAVGKSQAEILLDSLKDQNWIGTGQELAGLLLQGLTEGASGGQQPGSLDDFFSKQGTSVAPAAFSDIKQTYNRLQPKTTIVPAQPGVPAHVAENLAPVLRSLLDDSKLGHGEIQSFNNRTVRRGSTLSTHSRNDALDIFGTPEQLKAVVDFYKHYAPFLNELIYTPTNTFLGKGGKPFKPDPALAADHRGHVHVSITPESVGVGRGDPAGSGKLPGKPAAPVTDPTQTEQDRINAANAIADRIQKEFDEKSLLIEKRFAIARSKTFAGSGLAAARLDLQQAQQQLALYGHDSIEYYEALRTINEKKIALAAQELEFAHNRRLLKLDLTDPVAMANEDVRAAKDKYDRDKKLGATEDVLNQDRLDYRNKQNAAEAALFNKKLSDAQTAHDLGRLSDAAYLRVLKSEHDRLTAIKKRTQQETDELNTIDAAIKAATDALASGQFNISDIRVPTPYEVRRQVTAGVGTGGSAAFAGPTTNVVVNVNGGDTEVFKGLLARYIGPQAFQRGTVSTTKV